MPGPQVLSLPTLSWVPAFPELSLLALPPGVAHFFVEGQCVRCRQCVRCKQLIQQLSLVCVCPVLMSSLSELLEVYGPDPRGAGSPDASHVSSSLSMGTIPKDDQSALVSSESDPDPPLKPPVDSDPDDE